MPPAICIAMDTWNTFQNVTTTSTTGINIDNGSTNYLINSASDHQSDHRVNRAVSTVLDGVRLGYASGSGTLYQQQHHYDYPSAY